MKKSTKVKIIRTALIVITAVLVCRVPLTGETFPTAIAVATYMTYRNIKCSGLILPIAAGSMTYIPKGIDPWGSLIAMTICTVIFAVLRKTEVCMKTWQISLIAISVNITVRSIYGLATLTVYQLSLIQLTTESLIIFAEIFMTHNIYNCFANKQHDVQIALSSFVTAILLMICGAGIEAMQWPAAVFISIWTATMLPTGQAVSASVAAGVTAAITGDPQWGFLLTLIISTCITSLCKKDAVLLRSLIYILSAMLMQYVENGVILGIDNYVLFTGGFGYIILCWNYDTVLRRIIGKFAGGSKTNKENSRQSSEAELKKQAREIGELAQLYGTYLDSRSILSYQFNVMKQIMEYSSVNQRANFKEKVSLEIAVSQIAATGTINGDCCGWDDIGNGRVAMIISDGMGKGKRAAAESLLVVRTLLTLLKCGAAVEQTIKLINTVMMIKDDGDSFATVDLIIADKRTGRARIYKVGAAPTLIRRKDRTEEVVMSAVPLGVVNGIEIQFVETILHSGDLIIMMSDGVSDGPDGRGYVAQIKEMAEEIRNIDPQGICDLLISKSADSYIGKERDDLTVLTALAI